MKQLLKNTTFHWVLYSAYEWKEDHNGILFLIPSSNAKLKLYNPLRDYPQMILHAINIGLLCMNKNISQNILKDEILHFAMSYGLLGFMPSLPTTPDFISYDKVYFTKNNFIFDESMHIEKYLSSFFPFNQIRFLKKDDISYWYISETAIAALTAKLEDIPQTTIMSFQREYAERYEWLTQAFFDFAFLFITSTFYYEDFNLIDNKQKNLYKQNISKFIGRTPTYKIKFLDKPTIIWNFNSLLSLIQMLVCLTLTDESALKLCPHCNKAFLASHFCGETCKNTP